MLPEKDWDEFWQECEVWEDSLEAKLVRLQGESAYWAVRKGNDCRCPYPSNSKEEYVWLKGFNANEDK